MHKQRQRGKANQNEEKFQSFISPLMNMLPQIDFQKVPIAKQIFELDQKILQGEYKVKDLQLRVIRL
jgi:hypothetical protein